MRFFVEFPNYFTITVKLKPILGENSENENFYCGFLGMTSSRANNIGDDCSSSESNEFDGWKNIIINWGQRVVTYCETDWRPLAQLMPPNVNSLFVIP